MEFARLVPNCRLARRSSLVGNASRIVFAYLPYRRHIFLIREVIEPECVPEAAKVEELSIAEIVRPLGARRTVIEVRVERIRARVFH